LFATVKALTGSALIASHGPLRAGDVRDSQADIGKAQRLLGYTPTVPLDEGLKRTLDWFTNGRSS
jgi:UDP-N-acetylglucosamine 4-epimerase